MGIKSLGHAGDEGHRMGDFVKEINRINNTYGPKYDAVLTKARNATGNPTSMLTDLTANQINSGLYGGRGTEEDLSETIIVLAAIEDIITTIRRHDRLPAVDE